MTESSKITEALVSKKQPPPAATATEKEASRIVIHRIYSKNQQFAVNGLPDALSQNWAPRLSLQANPRFTLLEAGQHEVVLTLHLSGQQEGKAIFQVQLEQAGLFTLQQVPADQQDTVLYGVCANALFPYAAVTVNHLLSQAGLPHVYLNPLDFIALYRQHQQQQTEEVAQPAPTETLQ